VPFTQDAKDPTSDSWGIYQTNINTEMAAIYKVMVDEGVDLPGMTDLQKKQLETNIVGEDEKDVRKFTVNQKKVVREFLKNANLTTQTKIFKEMYEIKSGEIKSEKTEDVMEALYFNTTRKFYTDKQAEAVKFKATIDKDVSNYFKDKEEKMLNNEEIEKFKRMAANQNVKPETDPFARTKREMEFADKYKMPSDPELNSALTNVYSTLSEAKKRAIQSGVNIL
jgi:hypothetical protein